MTHNLRPLPSALTNHYLQSILPFQSPPPHQFVKTKQFYKPQKFIWNNAHRTSKRMYPYYHKANDNYEKNVKPIIQQELQHDRQRDQQQRIRKLSQIREQTRTRFHSRQQMRFVIEAQAGLKKQYFSKRNLNKTEQQINPSTLNISRPEKTYTSKFLNSSPNSKFSRIYSSKIQNKNHQNQKSRTQQAYKSGLKYYDLQMQKISKICSEQLLEKHNKIRREFKARKNANELINIRIRTGTLTENK